MSTGSSTSMCSIMSWFTNTKSAPSMCSMFFSEPVSRLSTQITRRPCSRRYSHRCEPRNPAPPVTTVVFITFNRNSGDYDRQLAVRPVPLPSGRFLLESVAPLVTALYRKYRPQDFDEVVGQQVVVQTLRNAIESGPGPSGVPLRRSARYGQDVARADLREGAELRARADAEPRTRPVIPASRSRTATRSTSSRWTRPRSAGSTTSAKFASEWCSSPSKAGTRSTSSTRRTS